MTTKVASVPKKPNDDASVSIDALDYAQTKAAIREAENRVTQLREHQQSLETAYGHGLHWKEAAKNPITSDEGVPCAWLSSHRIVNLSKGVDAHKLELSVNGRRFTHVHETPDGVWVYRLQ